MTSLRGGACKVKCKQWKIYSVIEWLMFNYIAGIYCTFLPRDAIAQYCDRIVRLSVCDV